MKITRMRLNGKRTMAAITRSKPNGFGAQTKIYNDITYSSLVRLLTIAKWKTTGNEFIGYSKSWHR